MTREQQDLSWACLPKEARDRIKIAYKSDYVSDRGYQPTRGIEVLKNVFGFHNLTSDTEPEELLPTPIKRAQQLYEEFKNLIIPTTGAVDKAAYGGVLLALQELFGDKCLPDKETEYSKQRFRVHDKVMFNDNLCQIIGTDYDNKEFQLKRISDNHLMGWANESALEPYTEPETKDNMEEKELDIYELLESNDDVKTIYSVVHDAEVEFKLANRYIEFMGIGYYSNGSMYDIAGRCMLYPSRALYEKYPLDPYSAWMEWKEKRKEKRKIQLFFDMKVTEEDSDELLSSEFVLYEFNSYEETQQAAEVIKEALQKFHENNTEK